MYEVKSIELHSIASSPDPDELVYVLRNELNRHFVYVDVSWVICPDNLSKEPFNLAAPGICGDTAFLDLGDKSYIEPSPMFEKKHNIKDLLKCLRRDSTDSFIFGCGYSQCSNGTLDELVMNMSFPVVDEEIQEINKSRIVLMNSTENKCEVEMLTNIVPTCIAHGSFFLSNGSTGFVLEVRAKKLRLAEGQVPAHELFAHSMNSALQQMFPRHIIVLGGVYVLRNLMWRLQNVQNNGNHQAGALNDFCTVNVPEPVIGIFNSRNTEQLEIFREHSRKQMRLGTLSSFHCLFHRNEPHFCHETTEDGVEILGYFCPANTLYRIDKP